MRLKKHETNLYNMFIYNITMTGWKCRNIFSLTHNRLFFQGPFEILPCTTWPRQRRLRNSLEPQCWYWIKCQIFPNLFFLLASRFLQLKNQSKWQITFRLKHKLRSGPWRVSSHGWNEREEARNFSIRETQNPMMFFSTEPIFSSFCLLLTWPFCLSVLFHRLDAPNHDINADAQLGPFSFASVFWSVSSSTPKRLQWKIGKPTGPTVDSPWKQCPLETQSHQSDEK